MGKEWTLKDPKTMGDNDPKYGQTWWSYTHDSDMPLMFNLMDGAVGDGSRVTAEEWVNKESAKGTEYLRLRKVKVLSGGAPQTAQGAPEPATTTKLLELIYSDTQRILQSVEPAQTQAGAPPKSLKEAWDETKTKPDTVVEDIGDEPINMDDIPF